MRSLVLAVLLATSGAALAQEPGPPPRPGAPGHRSPRREPGYVTYVGFQKLGDAPRVFLRVTSQPNPTQAVQGDQLIVRLPGFKLDMANNGRPLDTRFLGTAIVRVDAADTDAGVELAVTFAEGASPREARVSTAPAEVPEDGSYVYFDF